MNRTLWSLAGVVSLTITMAYAQGPGTPRIDRLDPRLDQLLPADVESEVVATGMIWAEGPLWDAATGALLFSDVARNAIFRWQPGSGVRLLLARSGDADDPPRGREQGSNGLAFDAEGRLTWCQHGLRRVVRREKDGTLTVLADRFNGRRLNNPNDLVFDRAGNLYFTDPVFGLARGFDDPDRELDIQAVYRLTPDGTLSALVTDLRLPNGVALSPDERVLYVSNAQRSRPVWMAYDLAPDGTAHRGRVLAEASAWGPEGWLYITAGRDILRLRTRTGPPNR